jgi:glycosyltransferase involved in cell wall biosynthesis
MTDQADSPEKTTLPNCVVVIPAHNEAQDIGFVIGEVHRLSSYPVVVIDDASTDDTIEQARKAGAVVVPLILQLGAWGATQTGLRYAFRKGYDYAITMDADGQHEAASLSTLVRPIIGDHTDVVIGSCTSRGSRLRKIAWVLMRKVSGLQLQDLTSGFRVYDRLAIRRLAGWQATLLEYQDVGVLTMLKSSGIRLQDVEVSMLPRRHGISRIFYSWFSVFYYMGYTLLLGATKRGTTHEEQS